MPLPLADNGKVLITGYIPNLPLAVIGTAVFAFLACAFLYNFFRFYKHRYTLWITLGTLIMVLGFAVRIIMTFGYNATSIPIYSVTTICILVAPCAFIAQNYYVLPKMAEWLDEALQPSSLSTTYPPPGTGKKGQNSVSADCLFLKPRLIGRIFLSSDVATFLLQLAGSGMTAVTSIADVGEKICLVGLVAQLVTFSLFITLLGYFGFRVRTLYRPQWELQSGFGWKADWRSVYWATLWTCPCIMIRCIFRVIEFTQGYAGTLRTVEWYFYVFDTLPLVLAIAVWIIVWPSKYLGRPAAAAAYAVTGSSSGGLDMGMQMSGRGLNSGASTGSGASGGSGEALTGKEAMRMTEEEVGMTHLGMGHLQQQQRPFQHQNPDRQYEQQYQSQQGHGYAR